MDVGSVVALLGVLVTVAITAFGWLATTVRAARTEVALLARDLSDYKLIVAKEYASVGYLKDVEKRLTDHLERIEKKLDVREGQYHG